VIDCGSSGIGVSNSGGGGGGVSDSGGGGVGIEHGYLMIIIEWGMGENGKGGGGRLKKNLRNDYNMVPLRNYHPHKLTSIFWSYPGSL
jgi:hypothetical protein